MKLTAQRVKSINTPGKYHDEHGLYLRVAPGGSKQWVWRGTVRGRRVERGLGAVAFTSLAEARDIAFDYKRIARRGGDPTASRASEAPTFAEATEAVIEAHRPGWKDGGRSEGNWRSSLERYAFPAIGQTPVDEITTADLLRVLRPIWHDKHETARKVRTRLGVVIRWAIAEGHRTDDPAGPALAAALPKSNGHAEHHASLPADKLGPALERLGGSERAWPLTLACLRFIAATACRSGEARLATWAEIDRTAETWTIPADRTKTGKAHIVPLSKMARSALDEAEMYADGSGWLFPSPTGKALSNGTLSKFTRSEGFTPHGCRASFRSWAAEQGVNRELAEAALAHTAGAVERAYQRSDLLEQRREVMEAWATALCQPE